MAQKEEEVSCVCVCAGLRVLSKRNLLAVASTSMRFCQRLDSFHAERTGERRASKFDDLSMTGQSATEPTNSSPSCWVNAIYNKPLLDLG